MAAPYPRRIPLVGWSARPHRGLVTIAASPSAASLSSTDLTALLGSLQGAVATLSTLVEQLKGTSGGGASAGAATLAGGPGGTPPGTSSSGCGCGGASGAVGGVEQVGQTPAQFSKAAGANGAPEAAGAKDAKESKGKPAKAAKADAPKQAAPAQAAGGGASSKGQQLADFAKQQIGKPYVYGAEGPGSFDCSGLIQFAAKHLGINVPRTAAEQAKAGKAVDKSDLQPGDLVYFQNTGESTIGHIGMYIGDGKYVHAPQPGENVKIGSLSDSYASKTYRGARRIV